MSVPADKAAALDALEQVTDPRSGKGLVSAGLVQGLVVAKGRAGFALEAPRADAALYAPVRDAAEKALKALPGIERAAVVLTTEAAPPRRMGGASLSKEAIEQGRPRAPLAADRPAHVRRVLAVASGKGGVGKSTVAANLAAAFARQGLRAGLLDADVYGPSAPTMLGVKDAPQHIDGRLEPLQAHGVKAISMGLLVDADRAMIWRGPMATQALNQMLTQTRWGAEAEPLDVLVVDLPPGTGDVQLTLVQKTPLDGVVIVSTPQEVALADARRAHTMFGKVNAPVLGLIENMSGEVFGRGGARAEAERLGAPFLGEIPLDAAVRESGDAGRPAALGEGPLAETFAGMARTLAKKLGLGASGASASARAGE